MRRFTATVAAVALALTIVTPTLARTPGAQPPVAWTMDREMFCGFVSSLSGRLHVPPTDPRIVAYCLTH